ncbi:MAG: AsmA family protein [Chthoniobacterales bacterium]
MGKLRQLILIAVGSLIALFAVALASVNLYVQSRATQERIQHELSQRLGAPLHIHGISVTPWGGLKLSGITIPQTAGSTSADFLTAKTFQLRVRFLSLFRKKLVIKQVSLINPKVVWMQDASGKWRLPASAEATAGRSGAPQVGAEPTTEKTPKAQPRPPNVAPKTVLAESTPEKPPSMVPQIERVNMKRGNFTFLDRAGRLVGDFEGVDFRSILRSASRVSGSAKIAKLSLRDRFFLNRLESPFTYEPDVLELSKISAQAGEGEIAGHFAMEPEAEDSPFTMGLSFRGVEADRIVVDAGGPAGMIKGKLEGSFEASGKTAEPEALVGKGQILLRDGQVQQYSLLVALGQLLQIEELTRLQLQQAEAKYHITPGLITVDELVLRSPNIRLSGNGTITFDGKLNLDSRLAINSKLRGQLFKMIRDNFVATGEPGYYALAFQVGGTVDRPKTNLMDRLVGRGLKDLFNGWLGGGKKKKKSTEPETPEESPTAPAESGAPVSSSPTPSSP